jgi:pimeloyl-ACP methyl ester carboxylesterase
VSQIPRTRYAKSGDAHIAYQVFGEGDVDLVFVPGFVSNIEHYWEMPRVPDLLERLGSFARVVMFDKRGTGLSDPVAGPPPLEQRMDDMQAVMGAAGLERAALFGISEGGPASVLFAATYPDRTSALVLYGSTPRFRTDSDISWGATTSRWSWCWRTSRRDGVTAPCWRHSHPAGWAIRRWRSCGASFSGRAPARRWAGP